MEDGPGNLHDWVVVLLQRWFVAVHGRTEHVKINVQNCGVHITTLEIALYVEDGIL
jgi:hypothetical protein